MFFFTLPETLSYSKGRHNIAMCPQTVTNIASIADGQWVKTPRNMMTSSNGNIFWVTGHLCEEFTGHRWSPRTKASDAEFDVFFDLRLNKRLSKHSWGWWFETPSRPLWCHCNEQGDRTVVISVRWLPGDLDEMFSETILQLLSLDHHIINGGYQLLYGGPQLVTGGPQIKKQQLVATSFYMGPPENNWWPLYNN